MNYTKEQISEIISKHAVQRNGLNDLLSIMLESMMMAERGEFLREDSTGNKGNGFRPGRTYGQGKRLEFRIPRDRYGNFHPQILAILRDQEEECEKLAGVLYAKGLTQAQVGDVFEDIYGEHYSKASISRMMDYMRSDVGEWLERSLEPYYPIVFIDCVFIKVHRKRSCAAEAFYVMLGVKEDKTREVIGIYNRPNESAEGWAQMLTAIKERGAENVGLIVADGLSGLDTAVSEVYPEAGLQRCTTHLKRNMMNRVRHGDKLEMANDLRRIFKTGDEAYTVEKAWDNWNAFLSKWSKDYRSIQNMKGNFLYKSYFTYLNYHPRIQSMIYTTNWIERLQKDFRRVTRMRGALPSEESVLLLMGKTAMDKVAYDRALPWMELDKSLFPGE